MKKFIYLIAAGSMLLAVATQCSKKKETPAPAAPTKEQMLAGTTYKKYVMTSDKVSGVETFTDQIACDQDDEYHFYPNGYFYVLDSGTKCLGKPDSLSTARWNFNSAKDSIIEDGDGYKLVSLTTTGFTIQFTNDDDNQEVMVFVAK